MRRLARAGLAACPVIAIGAALAAGPAKGQVLPGKADPGRVFEQVPPPPAEPATAPLVVPETRPEVPPEGAEELRFRLVGITLEGNAALATADLRALYTDALGTEVSLADLYAIAARITAAYRAEGYILSQALIPAQRIEGGQATIRVVEGFVDRVIVDGDDPSGRIAAMGGLIAATRPLTAAALERHLLLIQDLSGVSVRSVLAPSATVLGAADLTLVVTRNPVEGFFSVDNRGSDTLGPFQIAVGLQINDPIGLDGEAGLTLFMTPADDELYFIRGRIHQPIGHDGLSLNLGASVNWTHPGADLAPFDNDGRSVALDFGLDYPLVRSRALSLNLSLGLDWRDTWSDFFVSTARTRVYDDHLRILRAGMRLVAVDGLGGRDTLSLKLEQGLDAFGASKAGALDLSRANGKPAFTVIGGDLHRTQPLTEDLALVTRARFQYAFDPLLASAEIGFGGNRFGSAFEPSEITGDSGLGGRLEAMWLWALDADEIDATVYGQTYGFVEGGAIWQRSSPATERRRDSLSSTGLGTRAQLDIGLFGGWEVAFPLHHPAASAEPGSARLFFQLGASF
ncbi:hypothetical protein L2U69_07625 [Zavarzinia compransoris]|uniref:ShlB/FhaC/HecB family hemolysin secretion/activation protein n=1 Tax=Zavarzinia marina TaxID=2911065 RepID=UPI001F420833|nr:POTRA domain-containing protein [Zavarzinia marina]MCF4165507.1 hypothetical protein [Zavarzinia marina]